VSAETTGCLVCTKPRTADVGYLCHNHLERLAAMLRDVEDQAAMLTAVPSMAIRTGSGGGSLKSERSPARLDVLVHTDHRRGTGMSETDDDALAAGKTLPILDVLHSWARTVREDRALDRPRHVTISGERDLLSRHLGWVAGQPWVDEAYSDVRQLLGQLKGVNGTQDEKPVGRCFVPIPDGICDGPIWVDDAMGHAHCGRCQATWDGTELHRLGLILEQERRERQRPTTEDGRRMLTAEELVAQGYVSSVSNVRVRAHRLGVTSISGHYDPNAFVDKATA